MNVEEEKNGREIMEGELIFLGFIMLIGQIILLEMWNRNWFKRENFKITKKDLEGQIKLRHKQLAKELGVDLGKTSKEPATMIEKIGGIADILKNADPDTLKGLADKFLTRGDETEYEEEDDEDLMGTILQNIPEDAIKGFLDGLKGGGGPGAPGFTGQV